MAIPPPQPNIAFAVDSVAAQLAAAQIADMPPNPAALVSNESRKIQLQTAQKADLQLYVGRINTGCTLPLEHFSRLAAFVPELFTPEVQQVFGFLKDNSEMMQQIAVEAHLPTEETESIQKVLGIKDPTIQALYRVAGDLYNQEKYADAAAVLTVLTLLNPGHHQGWLLLGQTEQQAKRFPSAIGAYSMAAQSNPENPKLFLYTATCYEAIQDKEAALRALDVAQAVVGEKPEFADLAPTVASQIQRIKRS